MNTRPRSLSTRSTNTSLFYKFIMTKTRIFLIIIFLCLSVYVISGIVPFGHAIDVSVVDNKDLALPFKDGERLTYEVRYSGVKVGRSILTFNGEKDLDGKPAYHITFFTKIPSLKDTEEIYADKDTFLPIEVHRKIKKKIGFSDNVIEKYDQEKFKVDISSKSKLRSRSFSIQRGTPIHNAILLSYYYRVKESFDENEIMKVSLPTMDFEVMFKGKETIKTPLGEYESYAFTSDPPKFKLWLSADKKRIPLKIKNPGTLGYSLILKSFDKR